MCRSEERKRARVETSNNEAHASQSNRQRSVASPEHRETCQKPEIRPYHLHFLCSFHRRTSIASITEITSNRRATTHTDAGNLILRLQNRPLQNYLSSTPLLHQNQRDQSSNSTSHPKKPRPDNLWNHTRLKNLSLEPMLSTQKIGGARQRAFTPQRQSRRRQER